MPGPLHGYTVLELATMVSGPLATQLLGDQGADVIKIEEPQGGDLMRHLGPKRGGMTAIFTTVNRNKRSLALDLKTPEGFRVLEHLVEGADVFVQNFRPGRGEAHGPRLRRDARAAPRPDLRLDLGLRRDRSLRAEARLRPDHPGAVGAGRDPGRSRHRPAADDAHDHPRQDHRDDGGAGDHRRAARARAQRRGPARPPRHARRHGRRSPGPKAWSPTPSSARAWPSRKPGSTADLVYETADGYITASTMSDAEWKGMARATGHLEWLDDARFATPGGRVANSDARLRMVGDVLRERTSAEWLAALEAEDVPCAPILSREELIADPQVAENELLVEEEHPLAGRIRYARPAARFERTPAAIERPAPALGQHNREILGQIGYSDQEIASLRERGAFGSPPPPAVIEQRVSSATGDRGNGHN